MRKLLKRVRVGKNELVADAIFLFVSMALSGMALYVFDIHWNFYPGGNLFPPEKHVFTTMNPYLIGIPFGGIVGFFLLKLLCFAIIKEEDDHLAEVTVPKKKKR